MGKAINEIDSYSGSVSDTTLIPVSDSDTLKASTALKLWMYIKSKADTVYSTFSGAYADLTGKPTLGTAAALNHGTAAGNLVRLDETTGKLPALDGSLLTNLPGGVPGGSTTQVQFNDAGAFGGHSNFTYNKTTSTLKIGTCGIKPGNDNSMEIGSLGLTSIADAQVRTYSSGQFSWGDGSQWWNYLAKMTYSSGVVSITDNTDAPLSLNIKNLTATGRIDAPKYTTATRPAWVNGAQIFDTDLDKLLIGGASAWEVVTSI